MHACMALQCLHPSEQIAVIVLDMQYCSVYFSLVQRFCIIVLEDILKKLANGPHESEATVREVGLMLALRCRVGYNTPGLLLL